MDEPLKEEPLRTTLYSVEIETEAPYGPNVIEDALRDLAATLDFTGMYKGHVKVMKPNGELLYGWDLGKEWSDEVTADAGVDDTEA